MSETHHAIEDQALDWIIGQGDPRFDDWQGFEAWLAVDPIHAATYQAMAVADVDAASLIASETGFAPRSDSRPTHSKRIWMRWPLAAVAAAGIAIFGFSIQRPASQSYAIETRFGQHRTVALADGSTVVLNGDTRVTADRNNTRRVSVERGEAVFAVVHDEAHPFTVAVGGSTLLDVGTEFSVTRVGKQTQVRVIEGAVMYNPEGERVRLNAGMTLRADDGGAVATVGRTDPASIAGWRTGRLVYDGAPLSEVAADITRSTGLILEVEPELAARPFRGVIALDGSREAIANRLRLLLDVRIERYGARWKMLAKRP